MKNSAFRELYDKYKTKVYFTSYSICKDKSMAEDALQEVFIKVLKDYNTLKNPEALSAWLYRITFNCCTDILKKHNKFQSISINDEDTKCMEIIDKDINILPEDALINKECSKEIMKLIYELPYHYRVPIVLFYYNDLSIEDISKIMDCAQGTVKSRLFNAKKLLKEKLIKEGLL